MFEVIMSDTIAAIASGKEVSAIGIVRISGDRTIEILDKLFFPFSGKRLSSAKDKELVYGKLKTMGGELIDICLCSLFRAPRSYTGEDCAEVNMHGSPVAMRLCLEELFKLGARQALPGEFTKRAFINGKMDLSSAEAVIDLIDAETEEFAKNAASQLGGAVMRRINEIYSALSEICSHYFAFVDYPDEDIEPFLLEEYRDKLSQAASELERLLGSFERGKIMKNGIKAAIIGRPNAGKSSLLNRLLGFERAIVTDIPGTTRDTIEEKVKLGSLILRLTDTAGLRKSDDLVEQLGVSRSHEAAENAELVIAVFDGAENLSAEDFELVELCRKAPLRLAVINKSDLPQIISERDLPDIFDKTVSLSSKSGEGLGELQSAIEELFPLPKVPAGEILTNVRQAECTRTALDALNAAIYAMEDDLPPDLVLSEIERSMEALSAVLGKSVKDDIISGIFSRFCVGK